MSVNNPVARLLAEQPTLILDGALATELEARGCDLTDPLWSAKVLIENPELIYQVHLDYFTPALNAPSPPAIRPRRRASCVAAWIRIGRWR